jgi:hypothetical protein
MDLDVMRVSRTFHQEWIRLSQDIPFAKSIVIRKRKDTTDKSICKVNVSRDTLVFWKLHETLMTTGSSLHQNRSSKTFYSIFFKIPSYWSKIRKTIITISTMSGPCSISLGLILLSKDSPGQLGTTGYRRKVEFSTRFWEKNT